MRVKKGRYGTFVQTITTVVDFLLINLSYYLVFFLIPGNRELASTNIQLILNLSYLIAILIYNDAHNFRGTHLDRIILYELKMLIVSLLIFITGIWIMGDKDVPVVTTLTLYGVFVVVLSIWWILSHKVLKFLRAHGINFKSVIIIGSGPMGRHLLDELQSDPGFGFKVVGFFDDAPEAAEVEGYKGTIADVEDFVANNPIDQMYCAVPGEAQSLMRRLLNIAENNAVDFFYVPQVSITLKRQYELHTISNIPALSLRPNPLSSMLNRFIKRIFDLIFSTIFLVVFFPLVYVPIAICIKLSSKGPVFFKQKRTGYRGKEFNCLKFRSMRQNSNSDDLQATKGDARVTKIGRILRKTSIDELPQFINVWLGDMSIVGPRPHMVKQTTEYSELIDKYMLRHTIKPGITGWAQVNGYRGETKHLWQMQKRVEYDVWYAEHWSLMLDLKIIVKTVTNMLRGEKNAY